MLSPSRFVSRLLLPLVLGLVGGNRTFAADTLPWGTRCQLLSTGASKVTVCDVVDAGPDEIFFNASSNSAVGTGSIDGYIRAKQGDVGIELNVSASGATIGVAAASGRWSDVVTISSESLPLGAPVLVDITHYTEVSIAKLVSGNEPFIYPTFTSSLSTNWISPAGVQRSNTSSVSLTDQYVNDFKTDSTFTINTLVGDAIVLSYEMNAFFAFRSARDAPLYASILAGQSAHVYLQALTPGITLTSASGHDFQRISSVPEPASNMAVAAGAIVILASRYVRRMRLRRVAR